MVSLSCLVDVAGLVVVVVVVAVICEGDGSGGSDPTAKERIGPYFSSLPSEPSILLPLGILCLDVPLE